MHVVAREGAWGCAMQRQSKKDTRKTNIYSQAGCRGRRVYTRPTSVQHHVDWGVYGGHTATQSRAMLTLQVVSRSGKWKKRGGGNNVN